MSQNETTDLFTVKILGVPIDKETNRQSQDDVEHDGDNNSNSMGKLSTLGEFSNKKSAKILNGRLVELGHPILVSPEVKFKTVINYERLIEPRSSIGILLEPQEGFLTKIDPV